MTNSFKRLVDLARKTGDPLIVTDVDGLEPYVILGLERYEAFLGMTQDTLGRVKEIKDTNATIGESSPRQDFSSIQSSSEQDIPQPQGEVIPDIETQFYLEPVE